MNILASVCLLAIFGSVLGARYYISDTEMTWTEALQNNKCKLATPKLIFSPNAIITDHLGLTIREDVWTGYNEVRTAFEYFGCKQIGSNEQEDFITKADPGQCLSACLSKQTNTIGISGNKCFCLRADGEKDGQSTMETHCKTECENLSGIVCGELTKRGEASYMSLYRSIERVPNQFLQNSNKCMYYTSAGFNWTSCSLANGVLCENDNQVWIVRKKNNIDFEFREWKNMDIKCFSNNSRPSTYENTKNSVHIDNQIPPLWTGVIRSYVIYKYHSYSTQMTFGYLTSGSAVLQWEKSTIIQKKILCVNESQATTTVIATEPATTQTEGPSVTDTIQHLKDKDQDDASDVGSIVGATLTIVIVIAIAIVSVIYVRKRGFKLPSFLKKAKREPPPSNANNNNAFVISRPVEILQSSYKTDPDTYAEIDLTTTSYNEGNTIRATSKAQEGDDEEDDSPYSHDYSVLEKVDEGQYDTTKDADQNLIPNPNPDTFNPYNKLNFEQSSNYDHIGSSKGANAKRHVSDSENTYNTTDTGDLKKSIGKTDNDYDTADGTEDDTYNHTNIQGNQKGLGTSENDYDAI